MNTKSLLYGGSLRSLTSILLTLVLEALCCFAQGTLRITFDGPPAQPPGTRYGVAQYSESGVLFTPIDPTEPTKQLTRSGGGIPGCPENGSAYLQSTPSGVTFSFVEGAHFGLNSMDIAAYSDVMPEIALIVLGYRWDGTVLSTSFGGTGIEWRTVYFGDEWASGLDHVEFAGFSDPHYPLWSVDNIQLGIPEPSCGLLLLSGVLATLILKKRL